VIGVIDLEARNPGYFTEEHSRLLTLVASRIAGGIENAQLYTRLRGKPAFCSCSMNCARVVVDSESGRIAEPGGRAAAQVD